MPLDTNKNEHNCSSHKNKPIEYYCHDDDKFFCSKCHPKHYSHVFKTKQFDPKALGDSIQIASKDFIDFEAKQEEDKIKLKEKEKLEKEHIES